MTSVDSLTMSSLKTALRKPGCPLCRLACATEARFLDRLLWENVNDVETRVRLAESLGFCGRHSWQFLHMDTGDSSDALGKCIICEDLIRRVLGRLDAFTGASDELKPGRRWPRIGARRRPHAPQMIEAQRARPLSPAKACRVCEISDQLMSHYTESLVVMLAYAECQDIYAASDGICLPHLRLASRLSASGAGWSYLLGSTRARLALLQQNLAEFGRKQSWQCRHEAVATAEQTATERAVAFMVGSRAVEETAGSADSCAGKGTHVEH